VNVLQLQCRDSSDVRSDVAPAADEAKRVAFAKPARPGRGRARLIKPTML
jgi:hypothetical protein